MRKKPACAPQTDKRPTFLIKALWNSCTSLKISQKKPITASCVCLAIFASLLTTFLSAKKTMAVGELFLSAFIQVLFQLLLSPELLKFASREGIRQKLNEWRETLSGIQAVLDDAEDRQDNNDRAVKLWLNDLKDLAYDVDDILDEFATEVLRRKLLGENQASTSKVRKLIPACCTCLTPSTVKINIRLRSKITEITGRFNHIVEKKDDLKLREAVDGRRSNRERERLQPTSVMNEARICGREKDKETVVEKLLKENSSGAGVGVVSIVGMGGMGKTTLAQLVYNDEKLKGIFEVKAWVCVSDDFDVVRVTKAVLESVGASENCDGKALDWLQGKLKDKLRGKKFLVVMDDVWNEDHYEDWANLRVPFDAGAPGSKILVTTRSKGVSSLMGTVDGPVHDLQLLSDDVCLSILSLHALDARDFSAFPLLKDIGEGIAKKCKGLPLAATAIGGLLRSTERGRDEWEKVLDSRIWDATEEGSKGIVPALKLSYHHLPSHLKRCFAYCSIFPKDYEFEEQQLVLLWMAEGFIQREDGEKRMEDFGREYFLNLVSRSFFQQSSNDKSRFVMHDLISDLAESIAGDTCFRVEDGSGRSNKCEIPKKTRHSSYLANEYDGFKKFEAFSDGTHLRTFISLRFVQWRDSYLTRYVPYKLLPKLQCLRVLTLSGYKNILGLPYSIDVLKHLRYVDLSYTSIESLPESMATFYNLQTLLLEECDALKKLPLGFAKLVNLRHLNLKGARSLEGMPPGIGKLTSLQTLSDFVVGEGRSCSGIQELGPLSDLRGTLRISRLEKVIDIGDAKNANLIGKSKLDGLVLEWSWRLDESQNRRSDQFESVLNMLRPNNSLKELTIGNYGGTKFSTWLGGPSFPNMVRLNIVRCKSCTSLPPVGQLASLKELFISGMAAVKNVGLEFYGEGCSQPFKSLEKLSFKDMGEWENWSPPGEFPCLRNLCIVCCPKLLGKLPNHLPSLETVEINKCGNLVVSISSFPEDCKLQMDFSSKAVVRKNKVDFSSLSNSEFTRQIEGLNMEDRTNVETLSPSGSCEEMRPLWSNEVGLLHLPRLHSLIIHRLTIPVSLVAKEVEAQLPYLRKHIYISLCGVLQSLPKSMMDNNTCLECIVLVKCNSLTHLARGQLPPTLKRLHIEDCDNLRILLNGDDDINSCGSTSLLENLEIRKCGSLKCLTLSGELPATLKSLLIYQCGQLESIAERLPHNSLLESLKISCCGSLKCLTLSGELPATLKHTSIKGCGHLESVAKRFRHNSLLETLEIKECWSLKCLTLSGELPATLKSLEIREYGQLKSVAKRFPDNSLLESLKIECVSLKCLTLSGELHATLKSLYIFKCGQLESVAKRFPHNSLLETLEIEECGSLKCLTVSGELPATLKSLSIRCCRQLESVAKRLPHNSLLEKIDIRMCDNLKSLPMGLDSLAHLQKIYIYGCPNLVGESLPAKLVRLSLIESDKMQGLLNNIHNLTSLRALKIEECPGLSFPEEGFPANLTSLHINFNIKALFDWGLHKLTSLQELSLTGGSPHLISFPEMMLPASLTKLFISDFPNLESLSSKGFQMLASLENLTIKNCRKLTSLPKDGLPPTILSLEIYDCPLLKESCKKYGPEWSKIAPILCIQFDGEVFKF